MQHTTRYNLIRGYSIVELLIVLGVMVLLATMATLPFRSFQDTQAVQNAQDAVIAFIVDARTKTLSSYNDTSYGIHFSSGPNTASTQLIEFSGTTYNPNATNNVVLQLANNAQVSSVALADGGVDVVFNRLTGGTEEYGTINLRVTPAAHVYTRSITINKAGVVIPNNN